MGVRVTAAFEGDALCASGPGHGSENLTARWFEEKGYNIGYLPIITYWQSV